MRFEFEKLTVDTIRRRIAEVERSAKKRVVRVVLLSWEWHELVSNCGYASLPYELTKSPRFVIPIVPPPSVSYRPGESDAWDVPEFRTVEVVPEFAA